ncbi:MAG: ATP-binding cassette domain-containing protein [bacterium]
MPTDTLLKIDDLVVSFDGFRVLDDLSITIGRGELRFLIGPNGAGKTTLMDVISGKVRAQSGRVTFAEAPKPGQAQPENIEVHGAIHFEGLELTKMREDEIVDCGIGRKFQTPSVFGSLSCFQNVEVAAGFRDGMFRLLLPLRAERRDRVFAALERVGLTGRADVLGAALSHGERQWLEIAMLLVQNPKLLLLDEPVAGMTGRERERTGELLRTLEGTNTVIITEHDMDFVRQFARTVTVLHMGRVLREGPVDGIQRDPLVQEVYTGRHKSREGAAV